MQYTTNDKNNYSHILLVQNYVRLFSEQLWYSLVSEVLAQLSALPPPTLADSGKVLCT